MASISMNTQLKTNVFAEKTTLFLPARGVFDEATYKTTNDRDPHQHTRATP
jgi:hypothetical protein